MLAKKKVLLGMSGGVDSSVSAVLLLEQGYNVIGGFMKNWSGPSGESQGLDSDVDDCGWKAERRDAMRVAAQLGIPFETFDFEKEYRERVYTYMIAEYAAGRTPNPDVLCNKYMKFDLFLQAAQTLGCAYIATGHYARVTHDANGVAHLFTGIDTQKDQSYFLCQLTQSQIARALFPIGHLEKSAVRDIARKHHLPVAEKKDSQGICFVGKVALRDFLGNHLIPHAGNIVTTQGEILGKHDGFEYVTIGQREGLGVGGRLGSGATTEPLYVVKKDLETYNVVVAVGENDPALFCASFSVTQISETIPGNIKRYAGAPLLARIRYRQPLAECVFTFAGDEHDISSLFVTFSVPQRAVAPGQFIAFYSGDELLGSGVISRIA